MTAPEGSVTVPVIVASCALSRGVSISSKAINAHPAEKLFQLHFISRLLKIEYTLTI